MRIARFLPVIQIISMTGNGICHCRKGRRQCDDGAIQRRIALANLRQRIPRLDRYLTFRSRQNAAKNIRDRISNPRA